MLYGYDNLERDLANFQNVSIIGKSLFGRNIYAVTVGEGKPRALIHAGIHARECVSSALAVEMMKNHVGRAVCFVPMLNPDGVMLVKYGLASAPKEAREFLQSVNGSDNFRLWKANGRAVDLNVNFNAAWSTGAQNVLQPAPESYVGEYAESETETLAIVNLTKKYNFSCSLSLHTKGEVIYYGFEDCKNYIGYGKIFSELSGYPLISSAGSAGGYKDWFLKEGYGAGFTVELGSDNLSHPIETVRTVEIFKSVKDFPAAAAKIGDELWN